MIAEFRTPETDSQVRQSEQRKTASGRPSEPAWQQRFLILLTSIQRHAQLRFRNLSPELREDLVQEVVARTLLDFLRLVERGKEHVAFAGPLARYAVAQVREGRRVGGRLNVRDVTSHYSQKQTGAIVERLDRWDEESGGWQEALVEHRNSTPADIAAARIDVHEWLKSLPKRERCLAERLATGESTSGAARIFGITAGRISQLRRILEESWAAFQQETAPTMA